MLLMAQTVLCATVLAAIFTMQYIKPTEYQILGKYYDSVTSAESETQDERLRILAMPITAERLRQWWEVVRNRYFHETPPTAGCWSVFRQCHP